MDALIAHLETIINATSGWNNKLKELLDLELNLSTPPAKAQAIAKEYDLDFRILWIVYYLISTYIFNLNIYDIYLLDMCSRNNIDDNTTLQILKSNNLNELVYLLSYNRMPMAFCTLAIELRRLSVVHNIVYNFSI
jgi:hypothetical protein